MVERESGHIHHPNTELELNFGELDLIRQNLQSVSRRAGAEILAYREPISDTGQHYGHELSTIDAFARSVVDTLLTETFPDVEGIRRFEHRPIEFRALPVSGHDHKARRLVFIIDEIDGTTNAKRELANLRPGDVPQPQAGVSIAICKDESLSTIQVGSVFALDTQDDYSAIRIGKDDFYTFKNERVIPRQELREGKGDSATRIMLIGYSNKNRLEKGRWEDALYNQGRLRVYEGCRASAIDVINIVRGRYDAYVDPRALFGKESGAMLQAYDISASIPIALGCGFSVSDVHGESWEKYDLNDSIPLVISRSPELHEKILRTIEPLLKQAETSS